jgi:hypothetical protein
MIIKMTYKIMLNSNIGNVIGGNTGAKQYFFDWSLLKTDKNYEVSFEFTSNPLNVRINDPSSVYINLGNRDIYENRKKSNFSMVIYDKSNFHTFFYKTRSLYNNIILDHRTLRNNFINVEIRNLTTNTINNINLTYILVIILKEC